MKIATYLRVSTSDQSLEPQRLELSRYAAFKEWEITREYSDVISGTKESRTGLDSLLRAVEAKEIDTVMCIKIDRLCRSMSHYSALIKLFKKLGVALVVTSQNIDTTNENPSASLTMGILAVIAEFERSLISERTKAGLQATKARGTRLGAPLTVTNLIDIQECHRLRSEGQSNRSIAKSLNVSEGTIRRLRLAS